MNKTEKLNFHYLGLASLFAAKKLNSYASLMGVYAEPIKGGGAHIVATDAKKMVLYYDRDAVLHEPILIDVASNKEFFTEGKKKPWTENPMIEFSRPEEWEAGNTINAKVHKPTGVLEYYLNTTETGFPKYTKILPSEKNPVVEGPFGVSSVFMKEISSVFPKTPTGKKETSSEKFKFVCLIKSSSDKSMVFVPAIAKHDFLVMLMPAKITDYHETPGWVLKLANKKGGA